MYERLKRDGDWLLVFRHDSTNGVYFSSDAEARSVGTNPDIEPKFSALNSLEEFRREDGKFHFKLNYPEIGVTNIWKQSSNFAAKSVGQLLTNGNLAGGEHVAEKGYVAGTWNVIEKNNPGSSKWVVEQLNGASNSHQLRFDIPQSRLKPNTTYTLSCWVGYENESDHETASIFHSRWYNSAGTPFIIDTIPGDVFETTGDELLIDGVLWKRRYARFTTPAALSTTNMMWYVGYGRAPTGKRWLTNFMVTDSPIIKNYVGDYDATKGGVRGYEPLSIESTAGSWAGLEYNTQDNTLADGSVGITAWWYAIGARTNYGAEQMPGPNTSVRVVELWVYSPVGMIVDEYEFAARHIRECTGNSFRINARGVASGSTNLASCLLNDKPLFTPVAKQAHQIRLLVLNDNMTLKSNGKYTLSISAERSNFIKALNAISTEAFVIMSNGSMFADAAVDTAINRFNPVEYRGRALFSNSSYSYCAFGTGQLGIVYDRCTFDHALDGDSIVDVAFDNKSTIGISGFGIPLLETATLPTDTPISLTANGVVAGQHLLYKVRACVDRSVAIAASGKSCNLRFYNASNTEVGRQNMSFKSSELKQTQEFYVPVPASAVTCRIWTDLEQRHFDYAQIYKAGLVNVSSPKKLISNINGIAAVDIINSPIDGNVVDEVSWMRSYNSNSNLYSGVSMPARESDNVQWGTYTLTGREKCFTRSSGTQPMVQMPEIVIDPSRPYFVSMWVNSIDKKAGYLHLGCRVKNSAGAFDEFIISNGKQISPYVAIDRVDKFPTAANQWILMQGFILPHDWSNAKHKAFEDKFKNYFGVYNPEDDPTSMTAKGVGSYTTNAPKFFRWKSNHTRMLLRFRDEDSTTESQTMWALPIVTEVKVACFYEDTISAIDFSMM